MTHAGFWVDGAMRRPEARHGGNLGTVVAKSKDGTDIGSYVIGSLWVNWQALYWLDTTPRESLTPEELFSVVQVLSPTTKTLYRDKTDDSFYDLSAPIPIKVDWGNLTQYPPPEEPQWICVTKENVKNYLFCECRFRNSTAHEWRTGVLCGWDNQDCCCLVDSDYVEEMPIISWKYVEVQNAPTS